MKRSRSIVSCLLLQITISRAQMVTYSAELAALGDSGVTGSVTVFSGNGFLAGAGAAKGLEKLLSDVPGANCTANNGCGVHVHSGTACTDSTTQGGHYFSGGSDPWVSIRYSSTNANGEATFSFTVVDPANVLEGKPFIVHNNAGGRVACGILSKVTTGITSAALAPLSGGKVTSTVTLHVSGNVIIGGGHAANMEANLDDTVNCTAKNGCGVHVHSGTACTDSSTQGGHYYKGSADPWATIRYSSTSGTGMAYFAFRVVDDATDIDSKPFIVHNNAGGRVACGLLEAPTPSPTPSPPTPSSPTPSPPTPSPPSPETDVNHAKLNSYCLWMLTVAVGTGTIGF